MLGKNGTLLKPDEYYIKIGQGLVGMNVNDIETDYEDYIVRVVKMNGVALLGTRDYKTYRINVEIENGIVTKFARLG